MKNAMANKRYRILIYDEVGVLEQQINEFIQQGFRMVLIAMDDDSIIAVTMQRTEE